MSTRTLRHGDTVPTGEPARYLSDAGYVRLRWLVGTTQYVEVYEHRLALGLPANHLEVHHKNRVKTDNRPENLLALTKREHALLHAAENAIGFVSKRKSRKGYLGTEARAKSARGRARREALYQRAIAMKAEYDAGASTTEIGAQFGIDSSRVSVHLRRVGTTMRPFTRSNT